MKPTTWCTAVSYTCSAGFIISGAYSCDQNALWHTLMKQRSITA